MSEVLQTNIFFFVTGIAVLVFTLLLCILLYHVIKILKSIRRVIERIEVGSEIIAEDMSHFRQYFSERSFLANIVGVFFGRRNSRGTDTGKRSSRRNGTKTELTIKDKD